MTKDDMSVFNVLVAEFRRPIRSYGASKNSEPETALYAGDLATKPSRRAEMTYTPHGLIVKQKYGSTMVPLANVSFAKFE